MGGALAKVLQSTSHAGVRNVAAALTPPIHTCDVVVSRVSNFLRPFVINLHVRKLDHPQLLWPSEESFVVSWALARGRGGLWLPVLVPPNYVTLYITPQFGYFTVKSNNKVKLASYLINRVPHHEVTGEWRYR
jgi:hypothetical protein